MPGCVCLFHWQSRLSVSGAEDIAVPIEVAAISVEADVVGGDSAGGFLESASIGGDLDGVRDGSEMS